MNYCKTDTLHFCNRLCMCLNSNFDELKEFHLLLFMKNPLNFVQSLEFFSNVKLTLEKVRLNLRRNDPLYCFNTLLLGLRLSLDKILTH